MLFNFNKRTATENKLRRLTDNRKRAAKSCWLEAKIGNFWSIHEREWLWSKDVLLRLCLIFILTRKSNSYSFKITHYCGLTFYTTYLCCHSTFLALLGEDTDGIPLQEQQWIYLLQANHTRKSHSLTLTKLMKVEKFITVYKFTLVTSWHYFGSFQ